MRILIVEDNPHLLRSLTLALAQGHVVDAVPDGAQADAVLRTERYDVVVLDLGLPKVDGLEVLRRLRARGDRTAVLVLTASGDTDDRVRGLDSGADDYLAKPFELTELEARLRALHRRSLGHAATVLQVGRLVYDSVARSFRIDGERLALPPREHQVLEQLITRAGQPLRKRQLADAVSTLDESLNEDALEIYVHRLRRKLSGSGAVIHTLRGLGYVLEPADEAAE
jgi:two-component system, OmpR family, response regulator TctD